MISQQQGDNFWTWIFEHKFLEGLVKLGLHLHSFKWPYTGICVCFVTVVLIVTNLRIWRQRLLINLLICHPAHPASCEGRSFVRPSLTLSSNTHPPLLLICERLWPVQTFVILLVCVYITSFPGFLAISVYNYIHSSWISQTVNEYLQHDVTQNPQVLGTSLGI